ncbi:MAG TPA: LytTR family DNA-binding domain-containing protein [Flavobacteriales bacterium]|nr:LytTR family DNA-binding domain-containing protein [Flavobacteriales bacterium]
MIKTVLIDDESACIDVMKELLAVNCKQVQVLATAATVEEGITLIDALNPDLVFLDIELKDKLSFEILEKVKAQNFHVIFTTAHGKYAIQAIKASCLEYLLKPVDGNELVEAIAKFERQKQISLNHKRIEVLLENVGASGQASRKIAIPCNDGYEFVNNTDIIYCEADLKYTKIFTNKNERIVSSKNLGEFEELLQGDIFFRCHKSFIINLNYVKKFLKTDSQVIMTNDKLIDISVRKKDEFLKLFERA